MNPDKENEIINQKFMAKNSSSKSDIGKLRSNFSFENSKKHNIKNIITSYCLILNNTYY